MVQDPGHETRKDNASSGTHSLNDSWFRIQSVEAESLGQSGCERRDANQSIGDPLADAWFR
jgi:hypothetical protein